MSSEWDKFLQNRERLQREAEERARQQEQQRILAEQQRLGNEATARNRLEQLKRDAVSYGQESVRILEQEARTIYPIYATAESIRRSWLQQGANVQVTPMQEAHVELNNDGTLLRNRSIVGVELSYSYQDVETNTVAIKGDESEVTYSTSSRKVTKTSGVGFGIGYYGKQNELYLPPPQDDWWKNLQRLKPALTTDGILQLSREYWSTLQRYYPTLQFPFTDEQLEKGVKGYWVNIAKNSESSGTAHYFAWRCQESKRI